MLIKNCIYCIAFLLSLFSTVSLMYSIKNNNKYICKNIIVVSILYIVYLIVNLSMINVLYIPVGLEVLCVYFLEAIAGILYLTAIVLNSIKIKKLEICTIKKGVSAATTILIILPILFFSINVLKDKYLIDNSNLLVVYYSSGNGGVGSGETFAYAIGENFCEQFDLGIDIDGYYLKKFLPKGALEIIDVNDIYDVTNYKIVFKQDGSTLVYKNNKKICKIDNKSHYFNIDFEKAFYIKK